MVDRLGILGAGKLGTAVARLAVDAGRQVLMADERTTPMIELIVSTVAPGARLVSKDEMLASSDIVLLAIPYSRLTELDLPSFAGAIVIDATNPWLEADGANPPGSPLKGQPGMRVVRSMNHLAYEDVGAYAEPTGGPFRTAIAIASDDVAARKAPALPGRDERPRVRVATGGPTDLVTSGGQFSVKGRVRFVPAMAATRIASRANRVASGRSTASLSRSHCSWTPSMTPMTDVAA